MIIKKDERTELEFGKGDILMTSTFTTDGELGCVAFRNTATPGLINKPSYDQGEFIPKEYPLIMYFTKTESIDALIGELEYAKENMIKLQKEEI